MPARKQEPRTCPWTGWMVGPRGVRLAPFGGMLVPITDIGVRLGGNRQMVSLRLRKGWDPIRAVTELAGNGRGGPKPQPVKPWELRVAKALADGKSATDLAEGYGISRRRVYRLLDRARKAGQL